jgi:hypothetical protein
LSSKALIVWPGKPFGARKKRMSLAVPPNHGVDLVGLRGPLKQDAAAADALEIHELGNQHEDHVVLGEAAVMNHRRLR